MNCSPPGSSVCAIFQARILEQDAISLSRGSSRPRDRTHISCVSCIGRQILYPLRLQRSPLFFYWIVSFDDIKPNELFVHFGELISCWSHHLQTFVFQSVDCVFILFIISFALQKHLSLIRFCFLIFLFISIILGDGSKNLAKAYLRECSAYSSPKVL